MDPPLEWEEGRIAYLEGAEEQDNPYSRAGMFPTAETYLWTSGWEYERDRFSCPYPIPYPVGGF